MAKTTIKEKDPLVSIFMPVYNQEHLIKESIESIITQTYENWELIIGDDYSSDKTFEIALQYQKKYPEKIKTFKNSRNLGITKNCNEVLKRCTGKYIAFTAGDDLFCFNKLKKQVALMESDPKCILSYHDIEVIDQNGKHLHLWNTGKDFSKPITGHSHYVARKLVTYGTSFMAALSVMVRRSAVPASGYDDRIKIASDWLFWIEVCAGNDGTVKYIPDVFARYRKHSQSVTANSKTYKIDEYLTLAIVEYKFLFLCLSCQRRRAFFYCTDGLNRLKQKKIAEGLLSFIYGLIISPVFIVVAIVRHIKSIFSIGKKYI